MNRVDAVIAHFGGKAQLARALGVTLTAICKWKAAFPKGRAYQIEVLTKGKFNAAELVAKKEAHNV